MPHQFIKIEGAVAVEYNPQSGNLTLEPIAGNLWVCGHYELVTSCKRVKDVWAYLIREGTNPE
jgi:hypothetical protein